MRRYLIGLIGLALLGSVPLVRQASAADPCGATAPAPGHLRPADLRPDDLRPDDLFADDLRPATVPRRLRRCGACNGCDKCCGCAKCCPSCGCRLVPVCHVYCAPKTVVEHKYTCRCEEVCIPGPSCCCNKCGNCAGSGSCCGGDTCNNGCQEGCCGHCRVREVSRLVIHPVPKETPVRKCTVEWVCPQCGACGGQCGQCGRAWYVPAKLQVASTLPTCGFHVPSLYPGEGAWIYESCTPRPSRPEATRRERRPRAPAISPRRMGISVGPATPSLTWPPWTRSTVTSIFRPITTRCPFFLVKTSTA